MLTDRRFIMTLVICAATASTAVQPAACDESPKSRSTPKTCQIRRAATLLNLGTLLKQGDYAGAKFLLISLTSTFADCQGVLKSQPPPGSERPGPNTIAALSTRLINKVLHNWSADLALDELDSLRFAAEARKDVDLRCAHRLAETAKSFEDWEQRASLARTLQASLEQAKKERSKTEQKDLTDQLWEAMARNDTAAKVYRLQVRSCYSACAPIDPKGCHPDAQDNP